MSNIPTFLIVGSTTVNGPTGGPRAEPGIAALGGFFLLGYDRERYNGTVGSPGTFQPYWDPQAGKPSHEGSSDDGQFLIDAGASSTVIPLKSGALSEDYTGKLLYIDASAGGTYDTQTSVIQSQTATSVTVSPALTGAPAEDDVVHIGTGAWKTYRPIRNDNQPTSSPDRLGGNGDNPAAATIGGFGSSIEFVNRLAELYPTSPNFRAAKLAYVGGLAAFNGGASWVAFDAETTKAMSVEHFGHGAGDTPTYAGIFIDFAIDDIAAKSTTYAQDMIDVVALLRAKFGSSVPIWFVNPPEAIWSETVFTADGFTPYSRPLRWGAAATATLLPETRMLDVSTAELNAEPDADGTTEPDGFSVGGALHIGRMMATAVESFNLPVPLVNPGTGLATYFLASDSNGTGNIPFEAYLQSNQPSLLGEDVGSSVRIGQWIYSEVTGQFELYDLSTNDNANGHPASNACGVSASMLRTLGETHTDGVLLIKVALGGTTMTNAGAIIQGGETFDPSVSNSFWDKLMEVRSAALERVYGQLERSIDVRGFAWFITDNDIKAGAPAVAALQTDLMPTLQETRDQCSTRTDWVMPIVAVVPAKHLDDGGTSTHGTAVDRQAVRDLWTATAASFDSLELVNIDDLELQYDKTHLGLEGNLVAGTRIAEKLLSMQAASGAAAGSGSGLSTDPADDAPIGEDEPADTAPATSAPGSITASGADAIIAALDQAVLDGGDVQQYTVNGRTVTMRSLTEIIAARKFFAAQKARANGVRTTRARFN